MIEWVFLAIGSQFGFLLPFAAVRRQNVNDCVDAAFDSRVEIACFELRRHRCRYDDFRERIGQRALKAIAHIDAHLALIGRDEKQDAVVFLRLSELPETTQLITESLYIRILKRWNSRDDKLDAGFLLELFLLGLDFGARRRRQHARLIHDAPGERREL